MDIRRLRRWNRLGGCSRASNERVDTIFGGRISNESRRDETLIIRSCEIPRSAHLFRIPGADIEGSRSYATGAATATQSPERRRKLFIS